jgi:hypothetical protein
MCSSTAPVLGGYTGGKFKTVTFCSYAPADPNTVIVPCTPYSPEQKGKVESGIKYLQQNFINGREFTDDRDIASKLGYLRKAGQSAVDRVL